MTEVYINGDFEDKFKKLDKRTRNAIDRFLYSLQKSTRTLKQLPDSNLYIKKLAGRVLIFSQTKRSVLAMDIMGLREFNKELDESSVHHFIF